MNPPSPDDLPHSLRETLRASLDLESAATVHRDVRSTIEPKSLAGKPALDGALALLSRLGRGDESVVLESMLGEGGMGVVHLARQHSLDRHVAVKRVRPDVRSDKATLKLLREAWVTGALEHPNVVPVYDVRLDAEGEPQIVLKKIDGLPWSALLGDAATVHARFHAADLLEWNLRVLLDVADAVAYAHRRGIVHRDLKPENVMIGEFGEVYVVDWGLALALADDGTGRLPLAKDANELAGTPCYMAPEMAGGSLGPITERTDVFLLGALLYEVVVGRPPREGETLLAVLAQLFVPIDVPASVPEELRAIVRTATSLDPASRFASAEAFGRALDEFLAHRGSLELTHGAEARLHDLELEAADRTTQDEERRLRLYHLFGECRFGFQQALRAWPANERARLGLARAIERMVELELTDGDPRAASVLLAAMPSPSPELTRRVEAARRLRDEEDARRTAILHDHDPSVGRRTRVFVGLVLASTWTLGPLVGWKLVADDPNRESPEGMGLVTFVIGLVALALAIWARDSLSKSAINRGIVKIVGFTMSAQMLLVLGTWLSGMPIIGLHLGQVAIWTLAAWFVASTLESKLWPAAVIYTLGFVAVARDPAHRFLLEAAMNGCLLVNVGLVWGRPRVDVLVPAQRGREDRRERWREFLERRRDD